MIFRDISISFEGFYEKHDPRREEKKYIHLTLNPVELEFLSHLPKKFKLQELGKLNINLGRSHTPEAKFWMCDGIGYSEIGDVITPAHYLALPPKQRALWAVELIKSELLKLSEDSDTSEIIEAASAKTIDWVNLQ